MKQTRPVKLLRTRLFSATFILLAISHHAIADDTLKTMIPAVPNIEAESYILIDYNSGKVLAEKNADVRRDPASLTKMMTSYVIGQAIRAGKISNNDIVPIGEEAWATGNPVFRGSSLMFLKPGDKVTVSQLTRGINLQSGNDACVAMASYVAGSQDTFVTMMNDYVKRLGLQNTQFQTVHGLDAPGQYSSARDMALIGAALIRDVPSKGRDAESKKLLTWGFRFFETVKPLQVGKEFAAEPIWYGDTDKVQLGVDKDVYLTIPRGRLKDLKVSYVLDNVELHAPVSKNQVVGTINFQLDGQVIEQRPLVVMNEGGIFSRLIDYIKLLFSRWFG